MKLNLRNLRAIRTPSIKSYVAASVLMFAACLVITLWLWDNSRTNLNTDIQSSLENSTETIRDSLSSALNSYTEVLRGAAGLLAVSDEVTQNEWEAYIRTVSATKRYSVIQGISYIQHVPSGELTTFLDTAKTPRGERYVIQPDTPRDSYAVTRFTEPLTNRAESMMGFDVSTDTARRLAMEQARDNGQSAITSRTTLIRDNQQPQLGFVIYMPVYKVGAPIDTVQQRRDSLRGYISAGVRTAELMDTILQEKLHPSTALLVYDSPEKIPENLVYSSESYRTIQHQPDLNSYSLMLDKSSSQWTLVTIANQSIAPSSQRTQPRDILATGILFSALLTALLFIIMANRARAITEEKNQEVQDAKDSLISLASHQLRTPATGVKQFIGMILEGYAGKITEEQRTMLERAYLSNERQLDIINQILHVSRADSGRLVLHKEKTDINQLIQVVLDEYSDVIEARGQKITFNKSKRNIYLRADPQYMSMAIDNLISNASKYSYKGTSIDVETRQTARNIIITVKDRGVGIKEDDTHLLFQKFSRIDNELSIEAGGNGIGLYLCREIVVLHHGNIDVESEPSAGSTFTITIPRSLRS